MAEAATIYTASSSTARSSLILEDGGQPELRLFFSGTALDGDVFVDLIRGYGNDSGSYEWLLPCAMWFARFRRSGTPGALNSRSHRRTRTSSPVTQPSCSQRNRPDPPRACRRTSGESAPRERQPRWL